MSRRPSFFESGLRRLAILAGVCSGLCLAGCKKSPYPNDSVSNQLVILAEISAGDTLKVPVSKSIQVGSGGLISFDKVNSANVQIFRPDGRSFNLRLNTSPDFAADPASIYTSAGRPHSSTTYNLQVQDPLSGTVTAQTTIPPPVRLTGFDTSAAMHGSSPVLNCQFTLLDSPGVEHYYIFEAVKQLVRIGHYFVWQNVRYDYDKPDGQKKYQTVRDSPGVKILLDTIPKNTFLRLNIFTDDVNVANTQVSSLDSPFRRIFLPAHTVNGSYTTSFSVDRKYFRDEKGIAPGYVIILVKSVSPELYNYLFFYEKYKSDIGSVPTGQLYSPPGNIQNGLGIFGSSSKRQWFFSFDTLK
ncbi:MAG: DUF4249 family protein [Bacteroidetes bacterium]|nr:DUF4249 family protein [Bacteroidota bacterium]